MKTKILFLIAAALTCFGAAANAFTVEETAAHYANPGEVASVTAVNVQNAVYYVVKINGAETIILTEAGAGTSVFEPVANESELAPILNAYLMQQFDAIGFERRAKEIVENFNKYRIEGERCVEAAKSLIRRSRGTPPYLYITLNAGRDFPNEYAALNTLNATLPAFESSFNASRAAVDEVEVQVSLRNAEAAVTAFNKINENTLAFKRAYVNVSASRTTIITTFPNAFLLQVDLQHHCLLDANQTAAADAVITQSSLGAIKTAAEMAPAIIAATNARVPEANKRMLNSQQTAKMAEFSTQITELNGAYAEAARESGATAPNLTILSRLNAELTTLHLQSIDPAGNQTETASTAFDKKARELQEKIAFFNATRADYAASLKAVQNATLEVDKVTKKYGSNDDRIQGLQKDLSSLQVLSKGYNDLLRDAMTNAAAFQGVTANATALSVRAATLAPKENQFDFVLVGGVVILIAAVVGAFYYLRKRKSQGVAVLQPPSQPQQNQENPY